MKLKVKVQDRIFDVEVGDLNERPITAIVEGQAFEVWPEAKAAYTTVTTSRSAKLPSEINMTSNEVARGKPLTEPILPGSAAKTRSVRAPIPGVITAIAIQVGDTVLVGQELCKLEAMKMNNSVRSSYSGRIASILISVGQQVKHGDILMEFSGE